MDSAALRESRVLWSFWIACGLAATGGVAPLLLAAGGTNRIAGAIIPFGVAAVALAVTALMYNQGRSLATSLYFVAGIALVYGMLSIIAVPLRLAVVGTCPVPPTPCPPGFERPFTTGEGSGLAIGIAMGTLAILVGFFGLLMLYRTKPQSTWSPPTRIEKPSEPFAPAVDAAVEPAPAAAAVVTAPAAVAAPAVVDEPAPVSEPPAAPAAVAMPAVVDEPAPVPEPAVPQAPAAAKPKPPRKPRAKRVPKPQAELPAPEERRELPAPEEPLELPPPESPSES